MNRTLCALSMLVILTGCGRKQRSIFVFEDSSQMVISKLSYGVPKIISGFVCKDAIMFVLEMNNERNRIEGVGMVKNMPFPSRYGVYEDGNYNRYSYLGKARIDRTDMTEEEEKVMAEFDTYCFKGKRHQKRSHGITIFPLDIIEKKTDLTEYIINMFKNRL